MALLNHLPIGLGRMGRIPERIWYRGKPSLLNGPTVAVVGSRRPSAYTRQKVSELAGMLARRGVTVISGAAMGVDAVAHRGAGEAATVAVLPCGIDRVYPKINADLIERIGQKGLLLSQFAPDAPAYPWSFVVRNELVVALADALVVAEADRESGSMRSAAFAKKMGVPIWVLPHRLGESEGTNDLLKEGSARAIWDLEAFADRFGSKIEGSSEEELIAFCRGMPLYEEALARFGDRLLEAELQGVVRVENGRVTLL